MGNYSLIIAVAAFTLVATFSMGSRHASQSADFQLADHTFKNISREASITGLNLTTRRLVADTSSWATNAPNYGFFEQPYQRAVFTTSVAGGYGSTEVVGKCVVDTVDVVSVGSSDGGRLHEIRATYVRTCSDPGGIPPFFKYTTISERNLRLASHPEIRSVDPTVNADIHTNQELQVTADPTVEGFGSYVDDVMCAPPSACEDGFQPNVNGTDYNVHQASPVEIPYLVPADYLPLAHHVSPGNVDDVDGQTFDFTNFVPPEGGSPITGYGTDDAPFIWFVSGDLSIRQNGSMRTLGHGVIITEGSVHVNAGSNLYSSLADGLVPPDVGGLAADSEIDGAREWFATNMTEGITLALYAAGEIHLNGNNSVVMAQLFANGDIHLNGPQTLFGAAVTKGEMQFNGKELNIWYAGVNSSVVLPGLNIVLPEGIRLLAYSEW